MLSNRQTHRPSLRMRAEGKHGRQYAWPYNGGSAGSLQQSSFRENPTNFLTLVARRVRDSVFRTNRRSIGEM